jgi:hypothetical protein
MKNGEAILNSLGLLHLKGFVSDISETEILPLSHFFLLSMPSKA